MQTRNGAQTGFAAYASIAGIGLFVCWVLGLPEYLLYTYVPSVVPANWKLYSFALVAPLFLIFPYRGLRFLLSPFIVLVLCFALWNYVYMMVDPNPITDITKTGQMQTIAAIALACFALHLTPAPTIRRAAAVCIVALFATLLADFVAPGQFILQPVDSPGFTPGRASGFLRNPNAAAIAMIGLVILVLSSTTMRFRSVLVFIGLVGTILTLSRAGIAAVALIALFLLFKPGTRWPGIVLIALAIGVFANTNKLVDMVGYNLESGVDNATQRIEGLVYQDFEDDGSVQSRADAAQFAWEAFLDNPVTGLGSGATQAWDTGPHNYPLMLSAELGFPGLVFWLLLVILVSKGSRFYFPGYQIIATGTFVIFSVSSHGLLEYPFSFIIIFLLSSAAKRKAKHSSAASKSGARPPRTGAIAPS